MYRSLGFILLLALTLVVGCQGNKPTYAIVKGSVKYNGKAIEKGQIVFAREGRPPSVMDIVDGRFNGQAMVGENKVSVSARKKSGAAPFGGAPAAEKKHAEIQIKGYKEKIRREFGTPSEEYDPTMMDYIPEEWGDHGKQMRVVEAGVANEYEFEIKGKN
jgi:hypothetical protein